jgi:hypothetical protein
MLVKSCCLTVLLFINSVTCYVGSMQTFNCKASLPLSARDLRVRREGTNSVTITGTVDKFMRCRPYQFATIFILKQRWIILPD